ncbi:MAG: hypothetical protein ACOYM7_08445 [Paludibacter sp.]
MTIIKNHLTATFNEDNIPNLVKYTANNYRPYDPAQFLYNLVIDFPNEKKFSNKFIELVYTTLISWNMNQRGAKLSDFDTFKQSLLEHENTIKLLELNRIDKLADINDFQEILKSLFKNLQVVAIDKPKLVTFSKTLHFFLPNLLMPIDRTYTIKFFYNNTNVPQSDDSQFDMYFDIFKQFIQLAMSYSFNNHIDNKWNRNIPKIIDNVIIAHVKNHLKNESIQH